MEKFVDEAKIAERDDLYLYQAYDHEQALIDSTYEDAYKEGYDEAYEKAYEKAHEETYEKAYEEASEKKQLDIIKRMQELGKTTQDIAECLSLTEEKVLHCLKTLKERSER